MAILSLQAWGFRDASLLPARSLPGWLVLPVPGWGVGVQVMERQHTRSEDGMWEVGGGRLALDDTI